MLSSEDGRLLFEQAFYYSAVGVALVNTEGYVLMSNPALQQMLGYTKEDLEKNPFDVFSHPEDNKHDRENLESLIRGEIHFYQMEKRYIKKNGAILWTLLNVTMVKDEAGLPQYFIGQIQDITERKQYERSTMETQQYLAKIIETVPAGITLLDEEGNIVFANKMAEQILGIHKSALASMKYNDPGFSITSIDGNAIPEKELPFSRVMETEEPVEDVTHVLADEQGGRRIVSINAAPLTDEHGGINAVLCAITDLTSTVRTEEKLRRVNKKLKRLSERDGLTGVANRRLFDVQLQKYWETEEAFSLILFDLDYFKPYNDHFGHQAGDDALKMTAQTLENIMQSSGTLFRYGGEEFAVLMNGVEEEGAALAEQLRTELQQLCIPHHQGAAGPCLTASFGVSSSLDAGTIDELVDNTDQALYKAKAMGRNTVASSRMLKSGDSGAVSGGKA
ncbi:sensor domain-containing diguanylate cyclase [Alkalicoccus urumqiensis]|uniref:Sensor domain-containing diguanylate cyclase n=1 Tax=Alkalicoccus urumqiensis TaxID=1548213 RepID=A0A2P6MIS1_ALKUR|nr:PAS domain S-box protein [Alkalicoccus urumqiensis]PRO66133.1 hypothetical protein C6I21_04850 [Alkalicoccus urumqiensis]